MTVKIAIIADDLTGALDTGTPFVEAGLSVVVAIDMDAIPEALARGTDVIVVNTASRALSPDEAAGKITTAYTLLEQAAPDILFKKIDSRLKGNIAAESTALSKASGRKRIILAPAIPDQQRFTINGAVCGRGVETPLPIRPLFPADAVLIDVYDASSDSDLDQIASAMDWSTSIAVGARGLGSAFARLLKKPASVSASFFPSADILFAFGSRDPITSAQIEHLTHNRNIASIVAPAGHLPANSMSALPAIAQCSGEQTADPGDVAARFAAGIYRAIEQTRPTMLVMGGGDTALAILKQLGVSVLVPKGEIEPGIPWFEITGPDGRTFCCAVKSGGFGSVDSLLKLVPENLLNQSASGRLKIEKQAW
ncbi:four-carbon acid sugar kinase family protein [Pararhizobium sp.]|uniref:four-carbon acid sugar kinase family protein n=1 Tax=Pararhizobium sp. TaxID=1977563 RepID=UPI0027291807|nr:four-carbon acid sugar kinase family protein [Pararhizobium sp.]MDO9418077.1 four-carbon acid sugar kinase family protein [Pararhizobium sp.]